MEKSEVVKQVFDSVADRYDLMNDIMSMGSHRILKRVFQDLTGVHPGHRVLDVAGGTADIALLLAPIVGPTGAITILDVNEAMLHHGRERLINEGYASVNYILADAESMPVNDESFDCVTIAFGIRNMTNMDKALSECLRVVKPNGRLSILEFSHPEQQGLRFLFNIYRQAWPMVGQVVVGDSQPYQYLVESIDKHPSASVMDGLLTSAGFQSCTHHKLLGGIVAIHRGMK